MNQELEAMDQPYPYPFLVGEYDEKMRARVRDKLPSWPKLVERRKPEFQEFDKLLSTLFFSLYKASHLPMSPLTPSAQKMEKMLEIASSMPEWHNLTNRARYKYAISGMSAVVLGEHIVIPEEPPSSGGGGYGDSGEEGEEQTPAVGGQEDQEQEAKDLTEEQEKQMRDSILKAVEEANEAADKAEALMSLWGDETADHLDKDPELLYALVQKLKGSKRLHMISKMLGRLKNQMHHSLMAKSDYVPEEFVDITMGDDLNSLLPSSYLFLADEELEILFLMQYLEKSLIQQVREGNLPQGQGPICVFIDISGSMDQVLGNIPNVGPITRLDWAIAMGLTLSILAKIQNRAFYIGLFDTRIKKEFYSSSDREISTDDLVGMMSVKSAGGTNFDVPLRKGLDLMKESQFEKADLVFVTDGDCRVSKQFMKEYADFKQEHSFRTQGVACVNAVPASLEVFCDRVLSVRNVLDADETSLELFKMGKLR